MGKKKLLLIYLALLPIISYAKIVLPNILNDNMVLQQQTSVKLWGKANPNKKVKVLPSWNEIEYSTIADADGKWMVTVSTPKAGGPYEIRFTDGEELTLKNVLIGEVWFCSGQSNMEFMLKQASTARDDIPRAADQQLRLYDMKARWRTSVIPCSATLSTGISGRKRG